MERYEFSEREKQLLRAISEEKTAPELMRDFSHEELRAYLPQIQKRGLVTHMFSIGGLLYANLTYTGKIYMKENPNLDPPESVIIRNMQKEKLEYERRIRKWQLIALFVGIFSGIGGFLLGLLAK